MDAITTRNLRPSLGPATHFVDPANFPEPARTVVQNALARAQKTLAAEFTGITADGTATPPDLFPIVRTGVSVRPIIDAVAAFQALLTGEQRASVNFTVDSKQWQSWHNMHCFLLRHGLLLADLSEAQRDAALNILRASLSAAGYDNARDVMRLNEHAGEITGRFDEFNEWFYWISLFGEPSPSQTLGLADRRPPFDHQLLHPRRPVGDDARFSRLGAGVGEIGKVRRHARLS